MIKHLIFGSTWLLNCTNLAKPTLANLVNFIKAKIPSYDYSEDEGQNGPDE